MKPGTRQHRCFAPIFPLFVFDWFGIGQPPAHLIEHPRVRLLQGRSLATDLAGGLVRHGRDPHFVPHVPLPETDSHQHLHQLQRIESIWLRALRASIHFDARRIRPLSARRSGQPACRGAALAGWSGSAPAAGDTSGDTWPLGAPTKGGPPECWRDLDAEGVTLARTRPR